MAPGRLTFHAAAPKARKNLEEVADIRPESPADFSGMRTLIAAHAG